MGRVLEFILSRGDLPLELNKYFNIPLVIYIFLRFYGYKKKQKFKSEYQIFGSLSRLY